LKYNPNAWNIPIDLSTRVSDPKKLLVVYALQLLLLLATYQSPLSDKRNQFRHALSMLHRADDFQFIQQGLSQVLAHPIRSVSQSICLSLAISLMYTDVCQFELLPEQG
jgi:hypothetical protein